MITQSIQAVLFAVAMILSWMVLPTPANSKDPFTEILATAETLAQLRRGGFVLYLRHGYTDNSKPDHVPHVDLKDCSTQRPLTETGQLLVAHVGHAIRQADIPVGTVYVSPLCRTKETADHAFPDKIYKVDPDLIYTANMTREQKVPVIARTRQLLSTPVEQGSNRLLVSHAPNLMDLIGYFPKEGTLVIFRPLGPSGFDYVASITPLLWPELLK
ncbi:MAG: histidine phosphatase family protein [Magnetococcales bacterium]|nr:histidine phosphatase family protein [Magnetococcales bacterium]